MTTRRTYTLAGLVAGIFASLLLSAASAGTTATKQRVSFLFNFNTQTGEGSWQLVPLTRGPLKRDSGTSTGGGSIGRRVFLQGQRVTPISGSDVMTGGRGKLVLTQKLVSAEVGSRYTADIGSWRVASGTGAYEGITGGRRFAGVGLPGGTVIINEEGYVTVG